MKLIEIKEQFPEFLGSCRRIECGTGWYPVIYNLASKVTSYCKKNNKEIPRAVIIKEKFGVFVVDLNKHDDKNIEQFIYEAKKEAENTEE